MRKCVIISDNPSGLLFAYLAQDQFDSVTLIDTGDHFQFQGHRATANLCAIPARETVRTAFAVFAAKMGKPLLGDTLTSSPVTRNHGETTPFVGFGESKSSAVYPLSAYNLNETDSCLFDWDQFLADVRKSTTAKIIPYSELTSVQSAGEKLDSVTINMNQVIEADHFIFSAHPKLLLKFLPAELLGSRTRARLSRTKNWTRVALELFHSSQLFTEKNLIFLTPNQTESDPIVGRFSEVTTDGGHVSFRSTWETYLEDEVAEEAENIATSIKAMKKLVRRAFPALEEKLKELITIEPDFCGDFAWANETNEFREAAPNLTILPPQFFNEPGIVRCVVAAKEAYDSVMQPSKESKTSAKPTILEGNQI